MGALAVALVQKAGYVNAGTLEFLVDAGPQPLLPRDEHAAPGRAPGDRDGHRRRPREAADPHRRGRAAALPRRRTCAQRGHAIECRVYAEDPDQGFLPSPGRILALRAPGGPGVRDDSRRLRRLRGARSTTTRCISKLVAWGADRAEAIARMRRALSEYEVLGIRTTLPFFERVLRAPGVRRRRLRHRLRRALHGRARAPRPRRGAGLAVVAAAIARACASAHAAARRAVCRGRRLGLVAAGLRATWARRDDLRRHRRRPQRPRRGAGRRGRPLHGASRRPRRSRSTSATRGRTS